jgi:hypothetical protein
MLYLTVSCSDASEDSIHYSQYLSLGLKKKRKAGVLMRWGGQV